MSNLIQPFILKKTFTFYWSLAKMFLKDYNDAELSDFGFAIAAVNTISIILKGNGLVNNKGNATEKEIFIVQIKEESEVHFVKKAEIRTATVMAEKLNKITAVSTAPKKAADKAA
ncbi:hypothetical protein WN943_028974 [Citrus x changshan-huyou]